MIGEKRIFLVVATLAAGLAPIGGPALAASSVNCGGAALMGGAELLCSHVNPRAPAQLCTFSWALATAANQTQVVSGSFLIEPGAANVQVYESGGFVRAVSGPIVICQGRRGKP